MGQKTDTMRRLMDWARPAATARSPRGSRPSTSDTPAGRVRTVSRLGGSIWFLALIAVAVVLVVMTLMPRGGGPPQPGSLAVASLPFWNLNNGTSMVAQNRQAVNEVSPWIYGLSQDGRLANQYPHEQAAEVGRQIGQLRAAGIPIVPSLANITDGKWAYEPVAKMLHDPAKRRSHIDEIVELVKREDYSGIDIDYENLRAGDRQVFTDFITELGKALDDEGKTLAVAVFAKASDAGYDERNVAQDYAAIGRAADEVRLMGYDYHWGTSPPGPVAPITWVRETLNYAKTQIPPERIVLGVPLYGYDWVDGNGTAVTWLQAFRLSTQHRAKANYDGLTQSPWFRYTDEQGREHEVWFENAASSKAKFEAARGSGIRGVYLWMFGYEDTETWRELRQTLPLDDAQ
ncbi:glycosyl hydrolase family 18 protein [Saccharopolyspora spinosa]|uniref:Spore germination protein YaaH n=1 Tax=Saccharopolyspora spinosa TaxID=60894 RepID=A0A2N3Y4A3_SACSN|nr:glycosyl hydrolase family 18 protein [Saccharopolyspora spinosa]PKW17723.1 spore germination protein YaaH [Saccharopolyspora spinosa]